MHDPVHFAPLAPGQKPESDTEVNGDILFQHAPIVVDKLARDRSSATKVAKCLIDEWGSYSPYSAQLYVEPLPEAGSQMQ